MKKFNSSFKRPQHRSYSGRNRFEPRRDNWGANSKYRKNEFIKSPVVQVIDADGSNLGEMPVNQALSLARQKEMDLVEVAPNVQPPVCRIIKWSKFLYEQEKKQKDSKKNKQKSMKELKFGAFIADADRDRLVVRAKEFLKAGHNVRVTVVRRGRIPIEQAKNLMDQLLTALSEYSTIDSKPSFQGKLISIVFRGSQESKKSESKDGKTEDKKNSSKEVQEDKPKGK